MPHNADSVLFMILSYPGTLLCGWHYYSFMISKLMGKLGACVNNVYQAPSLFVPPLPGIEANADPVAGANNYASVRMRTRGIW